MGNRARLGLAGSVLVAFAAVAVGTGAEAQSPRPEVVPSIRINADESEARWHGMPSVAIDPANPRHIVISERHQLEGGYGDVSCMSHTSYDAGANWVHSLIPVPSTCGQYDTTQRVAVATGSESKAYFVADGPSSKSFLITSPDGGITFAEPVEAPDAGTFSRIAAAVVEGRPDAVYVARRFSESGGPGGSIFGTQVGNPAINYAGISVSTDGGKTIGPRVKANPPDRSIRIQEGPRIATGPNGMAYVLYLNTPPTPPGGSAPPTRAYVARSTDSGQTWEQLPVVDEGIKTPAASTPTSPQNPSVPASQQNLWPDLAVDQSSGAVYALWADTRNGDFDLFLRRSTDGGTTWSEIQRLSQDEVGSKHHQYRGSISVAPNGRVDVVYYDVVETCPNSEDGIPCYDTDVFLRSSSDGGATFGDALRLNARTFDYRNKRGTFTAFDERDVNSAIASRPEIAFPVWTDTGLGDRSNTNRDIFGTRAQYSPFIRVIPPPRFEVVATPPPPIPQAPEPPPPPPPPPGPLPPAQPIVPPQPPPLLSSSAASQAFAPIVAPGPAPVVQPEPRLQEATARSTGDGDGLLAVGVGTTLSMVLIALSLTAIVRSQPRPRPVVDPAHSSAPLPIGRAQSRNRTRY